MSLGVIDSFSEKIPAVVSDNPFGADWTNSKKVPTQAKLFSALLPISGAQSANTIFAAPNGSTGAGSFRALVALDIPPLDTAKITTGIFAAARLGSGSPSSANFLRGDGSWQPVSIALGNPVSGGTDNRLLYQSGGNLAQSTNLQFNGTRLLVGSGGSLTSPNSSSIFIGANPNGSYSGTDNLIFGAGAGAALTSGILNVFGGSRAGEAVSTGVGNLLFGYGAGYGVTSGQYNTAFGYSAMAGNGSYCVALGSNALGSGTGHYNVGIGYRAGISLSTGYYNTLIGGDYAGGLISSGIGNSCIGWFAGQNITTGSYNVAIGHNTQVPSATASNQTNINDTFYGDSAKVWFGKPIALISLTDSAAPNNAFYYSTTQNKACYKDPSGTVNILY